MLLMFSLLSLSVCVPTHEQSLPWLPEGQKHAHLRPINLLQMSVALYRVLLCVINVSFLHEWFSLSSGAHRSKACCLEMYADTSPGPSMCVPVQTPNPPLIASVSIIAMGTAVAGYGEINLSVAGLLIQLVSESAEAGRLIMTQTLLQGLSFHPIESMLYISPASVAWMLVGAAFNEFPLIVRNGGLHVMASHAPLFLLAASLGFVVTTLAFFTIQLCGSLTLKVWPHSNQLLPGCFHSAQLSRPGTLVEIVPGTAPQQISGGPHEWIQINSALHLSTFIQGVCVCVCSGVGYSEKCRPGHLLCDIPG